MGYIQVKRRGRIGTGKIALQLMRIFEDAGYEPSCLLPATGWWRSAQADVMRWEIHLKIKGMVHCCGSWQTMTEFVRMANKYGFTINTDDEIYANEGE